jgi:hypothetical protein
MILMSIMQREDPMPKMSLKFKMRAQYIPTGSPTAHSQLTVLQKKRFSDGSKEL